jgi:hypothetical protein
MVHASQQFTPAQLLDSGRRAETEGKLDLAAQFYRHLTDHYAYTPEAAEARNGLGRIGAVQSQTWQTNGAPSSADVAPRATRASRRRPVAPRDHYRTGRALALFASGAGWLLVLSGLVAPILYVVLGSSLPHIEQPQLVGGAVGSVAAGLFIVLMGQAARALFDQANALRELVALERAKIGHE